jgi:O-antigen/teichoic acid export membrane protein
VLSVLVLLRASSDLAIKTLQAVLAHFRANLVQLGQAIVLLAAAAITVAAGRSMGFLFATLTGASVVVTAAGALMAWKAIEVHQERLHGSALIQPPSPGQVWGFALFMYLFEASNYFVTPAFASLALAAAGSTQATIALFNVACQFPLMIVTVLLAGFQGLYRPIFASVMAEGIRERLQTTFAEISKVQTVLLVPAGIGLGLLVPDYIALLFGDRFAEAGPLARVLCGLLFAESLFNLGGIVLSVDRRYAMTMATQALRVAAAPAFVLLALNGQLLAATAAFGAGRFLASVVGFALARQSHDVQYPWEFTLRVLAASAPMAAFVAVGRLLLPDGWSSTLALTFGGAGLTLLSARWFQVLGEREASLLRRAGVPGGTMVARWLAPRAEEARC